MILHDFKQLISLLVSRGWRLTTLLVLVAMLTMVRLGFWQLDRLEHRRARNLTITRQLGYETVSLPEIDLEGDLRILEYRSASVSGTYDHSREIILKGQILRGQPGVHLLTPLLISGSDLAVLVDRGWIPYDETSPSQREQFAEPSPVIVTGLIRESDPFPYESTLAAGPQLEWYRVDIAAIQRQMPYNLLPVYVQQSPHKNGDLNGPIRTQPTFNLSEGRHLSYAIQWYLFAIVLGVGYLHYLRKNCHKN